MGSLFPDIPKQLNETRGFIIKVLDDLKKIRRKLSNRELKRLVTDFKTGVETINLICIEIKAQNEVAKRANSKLRISSSERNNIADRVQALTDELNRIVETDAMNKFLREHPKLAEKAYIKLYGEKEDILLGDLISTEEDFLNWIYRVGTDIEELLSELDEAIKSTF